VLPDIWIAASMNFKKKEISFFIFIDNSLVLENIQWFSECRTKFHLLKTIACLKRSFFSMDVIL
jgi:hypothetical protein